MWPGGGGSPYAGLYGDARINRLKNQKMPLKIGCVEKNIPLRIGYIWGKIPLKMPKIGFLE